MKGAEDSGSGTDSDGTDSNSLVSREIASGLENAPGELDDEVPAANFHAPSKIVLHEKGAVEEESAVDGVGSSGSGNTAGLVGGSTVRIDSPCSASSGAGAGLAV